MAPKSTGGPSIHRWPPQKSVAPSNIGAQLRQDTTPPILYKYIKQIDFNNCLYTYWDIYGYVSFIERLSPERSQYDKHISPKRVRYFSIILRQLMRENVTFKINLVSHLAAADCAFGVAGNIDVSKHTCTIIYRRQDPDNMEVLEVTFPKNGSLFFKNTSPYSRTQYFLSNEPSQPFARSSLCAWQSSKLQLCETL